jgi:transcriptional antiterminator NusG
MANDTMEKQWFVLHTLSGQEGKVRESIERRTKMEELQDFIGEVLIPTEKVSEVKRGKKSTTTRKFYPGYVLINMHLYDGDALCRQDLVLHPGDARHHSPGFIGGDRPVPLRDEEVASIRAAERGEERQGQAQGQL